MKLQLLEYVDKDLPDYFDPYWIYLIIVDHKEVGRIVLRSGDDHSRYFDGHIGYTIEEEYRGHYYSYEACLLLKKEILKQGKNHVIITCDPSNVASMKIIERLNCEFIEQKMIPKHLRNVFTKEEKDKKIYIWRLK